MSASNLAKLLMEKFREGVEEMRAKRPYKAEGPGWEVYTLTLGQSKVPIGRIGVICHDPDALSAFIAAAQEERHQVWPMSDAPGVFITPVEVRPK